MGESLNGKLHDASVAGFVCTFEPHEAELAGAFVDDALSETDALLSALDLPLDGAP
jgi:hypothetical protein